MKVDLSSAAWRKSSRSGAVNNCVEVARNLPQGIAVRDSKRPAGPALMVSRPAWHAFTAKVKAGEFDVRLSASACRRPHLCGRRQAAGGGSCLR